MTDAGHPFHPLLDKISAAERGLYVFYPSCELVFPDEGHDVCDAQAAGRSYECEPQAVHNLAHRPFISSDVLFERPFQRFFREFAFEACDEVSRFQSEGVL